MDSILNILSKKDFDEPPEIAAVKKYAKDAFNIEVSVMIRDRDVVISVPNSAAANALRLRSPDIKEVCHIEKRLTFRITS